MLIRDLETKADLERATIRFYEKQGLLVPQRKENGYREYTEDNLSTLLKIKLLRQLGMPLDTIKQIQQGSADFNHALSIQIGNLEHVMEAAARAKDVCTELYRTSAKYETLDAAYYLQQLNQQQKTATRVFREYVERPYHPIRRFLARMTDYAVMRMILEFLIVVILRIRPYGGLLSGLITYGTPFLMIPITAFMLNRWGTTPGKWLYGLSVLSENGCKLSYAEAKEREWRVVKEGYGFGIPVWSILRLYKSYKAYQEWNMGWDMFCEYQFEKLSSRRKKILAASIALIAAVNMVTVSDAVKPRYRGGITVPEFAANYNHYIELLISKQVEEADWMRPDGSWYPEQDGHMTIYVGGQPQIPRQNFEFQTDGTSVRSIRYENTWTDVFVLQPVTYQCEVAAITTVMSQKGMGISDIQKFSKMLDSADLLHDGNIRYKNITISWDIEAENCTGYNGCYYKDDDTKSARVSLVFEIQIHNNQ